MDKQTCKIVNRGYINTMHIQISILQNQHSGKDTHVRHGRVFILNAKLIGGFYEYDFDHIKLMTLQNSHYAKYAMGICVCCQYVYSIGGMINLKNEIGYSEKYDVKADKWINLPNLKTSRAWNCAVQFDHQWKYTFYGSNNNQLISNIEKQN